jgi:hypothetical protein
VASHGYTLSFQQTLRLSRIVVIPLRMFAGVVLRPGTVVPWKKRRKTGIQSLRRRGNQPKRRCGKTSSYLRNLAGSSHDRRIPANRFRQRDSTHDSFTSGYLADRYHVALRSVPAGGDHSLPAHLDTLVDRPGPGRIRCAGALMVQGLARGRCHLPCPDGPLFWAGWPRRTFPPSI